MDVQIEESAPLCYTLEQAILLYRNQHDVVATRHDIVTNKGQTRLGAGEFVTSAFIKRLLETTLNAPLTYMPSNVIATTFQKVAWFEPRALRPMYFDPDTDKSVMRFDGNLVPQPPLLFIAGTHDFRVFALAEDTRPALDTQLFEAPYWNIMRDEQICIGTMKTPESITPAETAAWTNAFFCSDFTHLGGGKRWRHPGTYTEMLTDAVSNNTFSSEWLVPLNMTVEQALCGK